MTPDIFSPYIELRRIGDAGMYKIYGGDPSCNDLEYDIGSGCPWASAYFDAFKLAISTRLPLWFDGKVLFSPTGEIT